MFKITFKIIKNTTLLFLLFINLTACSYSPASLKESYNDLASDIAKQLKEPLNPSVQQSAMIDDYAQQVLQWHRRNKLPEYSQNLATLATLVTQENIPLPQLESAMNEVDDMPHFEQATHLTYKMLAVAKSLSEAQITSLERSINNEYQQEFLEVKQHKHTNEVNNMIKTLFRFIGINLNSEQLKTVQQAANKLHDTRPYELQAEKQWNKQMIALLRRKNNPHFEARFTQLWNTQDAKLTGKALQLEQHNNKLMAEVMKRLIMSFEPEQKDNLSRQLTSMSRTFSEMANE
ncbi:MAG: DUF6279 family lipoprotein [Thiotrichaceae bacterium]